MRHADIRTTMNVYGKAMDKKQTEGARQGRFASYCRRKWLNAL